MNVLSGDFWSNLIDAGLKKPASVYSVNAGRRIGSIRPKSHELDSNEIEAIKQTQSKGFRVIDIDPNAFSKEDFFCVYDDSTLARLVGIPVSGYGFTAQVDSTAPPTTSGSPRPYWRTLQLEIPGTFLRVEFLPARVTPGLDSEIHPAENPISITPQNTDLISNTDQYTGVSAEAGKRTVLIDFETATPTPHLARHGSVFRTTFSNVLITFKQLNVRIRVTIGFNSEISETNPHKETSLASFGGYGLFTDSPIHPTPFCLTDRDVETGNFRGIAASTSAVEYHNLIYSPDRPGIFVGEEIGLGIFYITGFSVFSYWVAGGTDSFVFDVALVQTKVNLLYVPTYTIKRHACLTVRSMKNTSEGCVFNFAEPVRVCLRPLECLALQITPVNGDTNPAHFIKFQMTGYSFGHFLGEDVSGIPKAPLAVNYFFKEHPFPQDLDTVDMPRR